MKPGAVEMPGHGRGGKPKGRFASAPTALGNRRRRDFHIPTAPTMRPDGKVEIQRQDFHFPTGSIPSLKNQRKEARRPVTSFPPPGSFWVEKMLYRHLAK